MSCLQHKFSYTTSSLNQLSGLPNDCLQLKRLIFSHVPMSLSRQGIYLFKNDLDGYSSRLIQKKKGLYSALSMAKFFGCLVCIHRLNKVVWRRGKRNNELHEILCVHTLIQFDVLAVDFIAIEVISSVLHFFEQWQTSTLWVDAFLMCFIVCDDFNHVGFQFWRGTT